MGNCFSKKKEKKEPSNINVLQPKENLEEIQKPTNENIEKIDENNKEHDQTKANLKKSKIKGKKNQNLEVHGGKEPTNVEKEIEDVQKIIKTKKNILKKKNLELEEIVSKKLFIPDVKNSGYGDSDDKLKQRILQIVENNNVVTKNLENFNQEIEAQSTLLRKGSAKSEEIRDSVRKVLSKMANFDKDIERIQNSSTFRPPEISLSPLKIPKAISKVITTSEFATGKSDFSLGHLMKKLEEKEVEMDARKSIIEKVKKGEEDQSVLIYREIFIKELEQIKLSDLDKVYLMHSDVVLGFEENGSHGGKPKTEQKK